MLHAETCTWLEKNCYVDIWIEVLHALGLEPRAILPFTVAIDFEGDQWTFFKPPHDELRELYGVDVQELNVWRPLIEHAVEHLAAGRLISTEADAFWLPDTSGTDYRRQHTKSTIVLADIDVEQQRLGYFHNAGYFELEGEDFVQTFRVGFPHDPTFMPLFAETVRFDAAGEACRRRTAGTARARCGASTWRAYPPAIRCRASRSASNADLPLLQERGLAHYHAWAFATTRQLGASFELAASNLRWMQRTRRTGTRRSDCGVRPHRRKQQEFHPQRRARRELAQAVRWHRDVRRTRRPLGIVELQSSNWCSALA